MGRFMTTEDEHSNAVSIINSLIKSRVFVSQNDLANAIGSHCYSISNWLRGRCRISPSCYMKLLEIKRQVDETGKYTPPAGTISAGHDIIAAHNATVNSEGAEMMWKDYQSRMINAVLKSDLPFEIQNKVISIIVNA